MGEPLNRLKVTIAGEEFVIRSDQDEQAIVRVSEYVDNKLKEVSQGISVSEKYRSAILSALNIAGELFEERRKNEEASLKLDQFMNRAKDLADRVNF
ncbi:MAG: cell division protein ZapA [Fibrobacteres bacterium]|nr:cell division protein ZapA [Fibrobacterota bacterium]